MVTKRSESQHPQAPSGEPLTSDVAATTPNEDIILDVEEVERAAVQRLKSRARGEPPAGDSAAASSGADGEAAFADELDLLRREGAESPPAERGSETVSSEPVANVLSEEEDDVLDVISELAKELERYQGIRASLEGKLLEATDELRAANKRIQELEWQQVTLKARAESVGEVRQEISTVEEELTKANECAHSLNQGLEQEKRETARLAEELRGANRQLEELWALRTEHDQLQAEIERMTAERAELEHGYAELHEERQRLDSQLQETQATLREVRTGKHKLELDLRTAHDRIHKMQRVQETLGEKLVLLRTEKKALREEFNALEDSFGRLNEHKHNVEYEVSTLRNKNQRAAEVIAKAKRVFGDVRLALSQTRSRVRRRPGDVWPELNTGLKIIDEPDAAETAGEEAATAPNIGVSDIADG